MSGRFEIHWNSISSAFFVALETQKVQSFCLVWWGDDSKILISSLNESLGLEKIKVDECKHKRD